MSNTPSKIVYTARAEVTGGRSGQAHSFDPDLTLDMRMPPALGGPGGGANPEALFAMGYGACFQGALGLAAKEAGVDVSDSKVAVSVGIGPEGESFGITVDIRVLIPGLELSKPRHWPSVLINCAPIRRRLLGTFPFRFRQ